MKTTTAMMALATLAGCGGSESGGSGGGGTAAPAPTPTILTLAVSLSATLQTTSIGDDGLGTLLGFTAAVSGTTSDTVVADLQYDHTQLALDGNVTRVRDGTAMLRALASGTGEQRWSYAIGTTTYFSLPAMGNGRVFVTTMTTSSSENPILSVDAITGEYTPPRSLFASQWSTFLQPVPYKDGLYMSAGYYGSVVYGFDYTTRTAWGTETKGNVWGGETPAVDDATVYYY